MSNLPSWLVESRESAIRSQEWNDLTTNIYDAVDQHLAQTQVQYFTDLSDAERSLVLERAARSLRAGGPGSGNSYDNFNKHLSEVLDKSVNNDVSRQMLKDNPLETKTDLILNQICEGIIALLRKWPDQKYKLHAFLNQPLPASVRFVAWHLYLSNSAYRQKFVNDVSTNSRSIISPQDAEIQRNCESLLLKIPSGDEMNKLPENSRAMKAMLSYHHAQLSNKRDLADSEYYYAVPIVLSHYPVLSRNEKAFEKSLSYFIEMHHTFPDSLPVVLRQTYLNRSTAELEGYFRKVDMYLKDIDRPLYNYMRNLLAPPGSTSGPGDDLYVMALLKKSCYPWFKYMFVGCLDADPLLFVWDQYLITSDVPQFHDELLPAIAAALIISLRDFLMNCRLPSELENILQERTRMVVTRQLQSVIVRYFLSDFKDRISRSNFGPIIDPTEGRQWASFNRDHVPLPTNRPEQRNNDREKNEQILAMERRLKDEMKIRQENEDAMQRKIRDLERELDRMKLHGGISVVPLPMDRLQTPAEQYVVPYRPTSIKTNDEPAPRVPTSAPVLDLIRKIVHTVNRVAHGEGKNRTALNEQTKNDIRLHKQDLKIAEEQAIGRKLQNDEWNRMSDQERDQYSKKMLDLVRIRIQDRYRNQRK